MVSGRRALIVCHEASRTGAPRVALDVCRVLHRAGWRVRVVIRWDGPLRPEFEATGVEVALEPLRRVRAALRLRPRTRWLASVLEQVVATFVIARAQPEVVWCNTVLSACYVRPAGLLRRRTILHAHEPRERIVQVLSRYHLQRYWASTTLVGCAPLVSTDLALATGSDHKAVKCLLSVPDYERVRRLAAEDLPALVQAGAVVGACGTANDTKGVDLWLDLVARVAESAPDMALRFVWVGGDPPDEFGPWAARTGLGERVTFTGALENPYRWMAGFDVFTLTSRSDPFPLVVLEAMSLGKPVVAFAVGDVPYQVGDGGAVVGAEAPGEAARQVVSLLHDPDTRAVLSARAARRVQGTFAFDAFSAGVLELADGSASAPT